MPEISVIVPVYNVENYLTKCVDSILQQTFTDLEIILVDDGATDRSGEMCDAYAKKDARIKVIHKENGGLSDARNVALDQAQGKYIGFVDSDDFITSDMYEVLYHNLQTAQADLSVIGIHHMYYHDRALPTQPNEVLVVEQKEALKLMLLGQKMNASANPKLYKRELFANLRFPKGKLIEDAFTIVDILFQCQKVVIDTAEKYIYYHRADSITSKTFSEKYLDIIEAWERNERLIVATYPDLYNEAHRRVCWAYFMVLDKIVLSRSEKNYPHTQQIVAYLNENYTFVMKHSGLTKARKLAAFALKRHLFWYRLFAQVQNRLIKKENN